jgi:uncharacterized protein (TIGR03067 family)
MQVRLILSAIVLLLLCGETLGGTSSTETASSQALKELRRLQGIWHEVGVIQDGKPVPAQEVEGRDLVIDHGMFALVRNKSLMARGYLAVDPTASPKTMDSVITDGDRFQPPAHWIYELDGGTLRLRGTGIPAQQRPRDFASPTGSPFFTMEYRRQQP